MPEEHRIGAAWLDAFAEWLDRATVVHGHRAVDVSRERSYAEDKFAAMNRSPLVWWKSLDSTVRQRLIATIAGGAQRQQP